MPHDPDAVLLADHAEHRHAPAESGEAAGRDRRAAADVAPEPARKGLLAQLGQGIEIAQHLVDEQVSYYDHIPDLSVGHVADFRLAQLLQSCSIQSSFYKAAPLKWRSSRG